MPEYRFSKFDGSEQFSPQSADELFDQLTEYMMQYGDEVLDQLDDWEVTNPEVLEMLMKQGLIDKDSEGKYVVTPKGIKRVEMKSLEELFNVGRKGQIGKHDTEFRGAGETRHEESKPYEYGDPISDLNMHETLKNAIMRQGGGSPVQIAEDDLVVHESEYQSNCATVLLVDMSGSMGRWGKFAQAKKVAFALQSLVRGRYQGDFLQIVGFYTYAAALSEKQLMNSAPKQVSLFDPRVRLRINIDNPPAFVPEHFTNIHAGLQFARRTLKRQPAQNKQIIVITDGEPTAHIEGRDIMLIYPPSQQTEAITLAEAKRCAQEGINVSSFALIEDYFYLELMNFVEKMAMVTGGISAHCKADNLGSVVIDSFVNGRKKRQTR
jgi:uncharacterized protein with von Willebrand factor type A (vWA) domain